MIQRIQTIWLFLIAVLSGLLLFMPVTEKINPEIVSSFPLDMLFMIGNGLIGILAIVTIFLYKNRPLQIKLSYGLLSLLILSCVLIAHHIWVSPPENIIYEYPIVFPIIAIVLNISAIHSIKKDEKLVRSLDRLR